MWSNTSDLEGVLRDAGLGEWGPRLAQLARRCVILVPGPIEQGPNAPLGACRLGGEPDMPPDVDWPARPPLIGEAGYAGRYPAGIMLGRWHWLHRLFSTRRWRDAIEGWERSQRAEQDVRSRDWPLSFIAQVDFAEVHAAHALDGFPCAGRLLFFCDPCNWPWGKRDEQTRVHIIFTNCRSTAWSGDDRQGSSMRPKRNCRCRGATFRAAGLCVPPPGCCLPLGDRGECLGLPLEPRGVGLCGASILCLRSVLGRSLCAASRAPLARMAGHDPPSRGTAVSIQEPVEAECVKLAEHTAGRGAATRPGRCTDPFEGAAGARRRMAARAADRQRHPRSAWNAVIWDGFISAHAERSWRPAASTGRGRSCSATEEAPRHRVFQTASMTSRSVQPEGLALLGAHAFQRGQF